LHIGPRAATTQENTEHADAIVQEVEPRITAKRPE